MKQIIRLTEQDLHNIIRESVNRLCESYYGAEDIEWDDVDQIYFTVEQSYDEDELNDELDKQEFDNDEERNKFIEEYKQKNLYFDCDFFDCDGEDIGNVLTTMDMLDYDIDYDLAELIIAEYNKNPSTNLRYHIEDILASTYSDLRPEDAAKHLFKTSNEYCKGMHGFILQDGTIILMPPGSDHNQIGGVNGIESKWEFIQRGNVSIFDNCVRIGKELTDSQEAVLRQLVASYDEVYVSLFADNGREYSGCFYDVSPSYFCNVFDRYYREGILPSDMLNNNI